MRKRQRKFACEHRRLSFDKILLFNQFDKKCVLRFWKPVTVHAEKMCHMVDKLLIWIKNILLSSEFQLFILLNVFSLRCWLTFPFSKFCNHYSESNLNCYSLKSSDYWHLRSIVLLTLLWPTYIHVPILLTV